MSAERIIFSVYIGYKLKFLGLYITQYKQTTVQSCFHLPLDEAILGIENIYFVLITVCLHLPSLSFLGELDIYLLGM